MRIDKAQVLDILRGLGKDTGGAERDLPDQVDTDEHSDLLGRFGISGGELLSQFGGGAGDRSSSDRIDDGMDGPASGSGGTIAGVSGNIIPGGGH